METKAITKLVKESAAITITSPADLAKASEQYALLKDQFKAVETHEKKILAPLNQAIDAARNEWRPLKDSLKGAIDKLKTAMTNYQTKADAEAEAKKDKLVERVGKGTMKPETAIKKMNEVAIPEKKVGAVTFVTDYEIEIVDLYKVPFKYLKVELKLAEVKKAAKEGLQINGLIIKEVKVPKKF